MNNHTLFIAGVPATGKTWLGNWLAENHNYSHIDAERNSGADFDQAGIHTESDQLILTGRATGFIRRVRELQNPIVVNWGFPTSFLYVVRALQEEGVCAWWLNGSRQLARQAFIRRGGIDPIYFDRQIDAIEREWLLIKYVFASRIVEGLHADGSQRIPEEIWRDISAVG